jgi:hypothetical protein
MMGGAPPRPAPSTVGRCLTGLILLALLLPGAARAENPLPAPSFQPGMGWTYQQREDITGRTIGVVRLDVVAVTPGQVTVNFTPSGKDSARERWDASGNWLQVGSRGWEWLGQLMDRSTHVEFVPALPLYRFPLRPGASWAETVMAVDPGSGRKTEVRLFAKALKWEEVTGPAGKFMALKLRRVLALEQGGEFRSRMTVTLLDWYSPQVAGSVRTVCDWEFQDPRRPRGDQLVKGGRERWDLTEYTPAK